MLKVTVKNMHISTENLVLLIQLRLTFNHAKGESQGHAHYSMMYIWQMVAEGSKRYYYHNYNFRLMVSFAHVDL